MRKSVGVVPLVAILAACGDSTTTPSASTAVATTATTSAPTTTTTSTTSTTSTTTTTLRAANDVSGMWHSEARSWDFQLRQSGTGLSGTVVGFKGIAYTNPDHPDLQITGTVSASGQVQFKANAFAIDFSGTVEGGGLRMNGSIYDCANTTCRNYGEVLIKR